MSQREAAEARGVSVSAACMAAKRLGLTFRNVRSDPKFAAARDERMRRLNADPKFAAARDERSAERMRRLHADPESNPLVMLSPDERADYDTLKRGGYSRHEALAAIGRLDILERKRAAE